MSPPRSTESGAGDEVFLFPLSYAQQRMWFLDQLGAGFKIHAAMRIEGPLEVAALERSLAEIVARHEVLRTSFGTDRGDPVQMVAPEVELRVPLLDLSGLEEADQLEQRDRIAHEERHRPVDLSSSPLLRAVIMRLGEQEHTLLVTVPHIVFDGWSWGVFVRELSQLYEAFSLGTPSPLSELPIQYGDFAVWEREYLSGDQV
jgi:NRPS condensation-like uncharacterized protein